MVMMRSDLSYMLPLSLKHEDVCFGMFLIDRSVLYSIKSLFSAGCLSMYAEPPSSPTSLNSLTTPALVQFQLGLFREVVRVSAGNLSYRHAKRLAAEIIERKVTSTQVLSNAAVGVL